MLLNLIKAWLSVQTSGNLTMHNCLFELQGVLPRPVLSYICIPPSYSKLQVLSNTA